MLGPGDLDIAERDRAVAGLPLLLDGEALGRWLSDRVKTACVVNGQRMRYKPGTSCTMSFRLTGAGDEPISCVAKTYAEASASKARKTTERIPQGAVLAWEPALGLVVTTCAGDRDLPALAKLYDEQQREHLLDRVLPGLHRDSGIGIHTLRHNPERRWVGVLETAERGRVLLRAYRLGRSEQHRRAYTRLAAAAPRTPELLGRSRRNGLIAVEWIDGEPLSTLAPLPAHLEAAGRALAQLHSGHAHRSLGGTGPESEARRVRDAADEIAGLLPDLARQVLDAADRTASRLERLGADRTMLHGDFSTDQVVIGPDGEAALIDLDSARVGDAAIDLSCASAQLVDGGASDAPRTASATVHALHEGYASLLPLPEADRLATHTAAYLLRRAVDPFRNREPDWPRHTERLVELAGQRLHSGNEQGWATW